MSEGLKMDDEYTCALCEEIFQKGQTDEEAIEEAKIVFGTYSKEDMVIVCDDCYPIILLEAKIRGIGGIE